MNNKCVKEMIIGYLVLIISSFFAILIYYLTKSENILMGIICFPVIGLCIIVKGFWDLAKEFKE